MNHPAQLSRRCSRVHQGFCGKSRESPPCAISHSANPGVAPFRVCSHRASSNPPDHLFCKPSLSAPNSLLLQEPSQPWESTSVMTLSLWSFPPPNPQLITSYQPKNYLALPFLVWCFVVVVVILGCLFECFLDKISHVALVLEFAL